MKYILFLVISLLSVNLFAETDNSTDIHEELFRLSIIGDDYQLRNFLNENKVKMNYKDSTGKTALIKAAERGHIKIIQLLIEKGSKIDIQDVKKNTPLHYAALNGHSVIAEILYDNNADLNILNETGSSALMIASEKGDLDIVKILTKKRNFFCGFLCISKGNVELDLRDNEGNTALTYATLKGRDDVIQYLVDIGVDINARDKNGDTALMRAVMNQTKYKKTIELLIEKKANLDIRDKDGKTALIKSVEQKNIEVFRILLGKNANIHIKDNNNKTSLMYAVEILNSTMVNDLIQKGSRTDDIDNNSRSAKDWLSSRKETKEYNEITKILNREPYFNNDDIINIDTIPDSDFQIKLKENRFALIIGNETYSNGKNVPYAEKDAKTFKEYATKILGVPKENIKYQVNISDKNSFDQLLKKLNERSKMQKEREDAELFFYYAGHGYPSKDNKSSYIVPTGAKPEDYEGTSIPFSDILKHLKGYTKVLVFMDACYTNLLSESELGGRDLEINYEDNNDAEKIAILTASKSDQKAYPYKNQEHGLFSFYLFRNLQKGYKNGNLKLEELYKDIRVNVHEFTTKNESEFQNPQEPQLKASNSLKNWNLIPNEKGE